MATKKTSPPADPAGTATQHITDKIKALGDWRGETLAWVRERIHAADRAIEEEWKWMGTPVWAHDGIVCTGETYKQVVKLTFARGAALDDPQRLFNASLEGNARRAIDIREGERLDETAFKALILSAVAANGAALSARAARQTASKTAARAASESTKTTAKKPAKESADKPASKLAGKPASKANKSTANSASKPAMKTARSPSRKA